MDITHLSHNDTLYILCIYMICSLCLFSIKTEHTVRSYKALVYFLVRLLLDESIKIIEILLMNAFFFLESGFFRMNVNCTLFFKNDDICL